MIKFCFASSVALLLLLAGYAAAVDKPAKKPKSSATQQVAKADWSQWRGPQRNGMSSETGLLSEWPEGGPPLAWSAKGLGSGYSSVVVSGGKIFTMGKRADGEYLIALSTNGGNELWAAKVGNADHSNCTPTVDGDLVFALGLEGELVCVNAETGAEEWRKNYAQEFGGQMMSGWGFSESPLVDGDRLICTPGSSKGMMAALDKRTGKTIWTTPMPANAGPNGTDGAGYSSIVISEAAGVRQYVQLVGRGVIGVSAKDGKLLWGYNRIANGTANIPTPIVSGDYVFCSSGYGTGAALLKLSGGQKGVTAKEVYFLNADTMQNHHGGMVLIGDHIYAGHGHNNGFPICIEMKSGKIVWGPERGPGTDSAAIAYADGHLYFRYQNAVMALIEATPKEYRLKGSFEIATHHGESWAHPVIAGGKLYLRDQDELHCYDVKKK